MIDIEIRKQPTFSKQRVINEKMIKRNALGMMILFL